MELIYASEEIKLQCTSVKAAKKLFGGDAVMARSLLARMNIIQPLDDAKKPYNPCNIDQIAGSVRIVEITEVSKHYE